MARASVDARCQYAGIDVVGVGSVLPCGFGGSGLTGFKVQRACDQKASKTGKMRPWRCAPCYGASVYGGLSTAL